MAQLTAPAGVGVDAAGAVYVADPNYARIRKITPDGTVSTFAGSGRGGFADGPAASAQFSFPDGVTLDSAGTIYVTDAANHRIRRITLDGTVSTLAGSVPPDLTPPSGSAPGAGTGGLADGPGASAPFYEPYGVAVDAAGVVYVADTGNQRIRTITSDGMVATLAGSGQAGYADGPGPSAEFDDPDSVAVDAAGTAYVAEFTNNRVRTIAWDGTVATLAGSGPTGFNSGGFNDDPAVSAQFFGPTDVAVDRSGTVYVADTGNNRIRRIAPDGMVSTLAGSGQRGLLDGPGATAQFDYPWAITVDAVGTVYVADRNNGVIRQITSQPAP